MRTFDIEAHNEYGENIILANGNRLAVLKTFNTPEDAINWGRQWREENEFSGFTVWEHIVTEH